MTVTTEQQRIIDEIASQAVDIEKIGSYTLADAIREGASVTEPEAGWGTGSSACALHAAAMAAVARGYIS